MKRSDRATSRGVPELWEVRELCASRHVVWVTMIERILPQGVTAVEARGDAAGGMLFPEERAALGKAAQKRRREPEELPWLSRLGRDEPAVHWDRVLFSAKESVYKAWYPLVKRCLGFEDAILTVHPREGTFHARLLSPGPVLNGLPLTGFAGRWLVRDELVMTAVALTRTASGTGAEAR